MNKGLSLKEIRALAKKIRPVIRFLKNEGALVESTEPKRGILYYIQPVDPITTVYTGCPVPEKRARELKKSATIITRHGLCLHGPKPTIAEVIVCIPKRYLSKTVAFELIPINNGYANNFYRAKTILYKRAEKAASRN